MAASAKRALSRCKAPAVIAVHPTKGKRRISLRRVAAQGRIAAFVDIWSRLGASVR